VKIAFKNHIKSRFPELSEQAFVLACSGGIDSVVMAHLCAKMGLVFALAHCNFNLRGSASQADADFVHKLGAQLSVPVFVNAFNTEGYVEKHKISIQMAARQLRYDWFEELISNTNYTYLVTAHHRDDTLETMLINLTRGTGIEGLLGIPDKRDYIRRPLLPFSRLDIAEYAKKNQILWREDSSNADTKYLRNKIRHSLIPILESLHPTALENIIQTQHHLSQTAALSELYITGLKMSLCKETEKGIQIDINSLLSAPALIASLYALFSPYGFVDSKAVLDLCHGETAKKLVSDTHLLYKDRNILFLYTISQSQATEASFTIYDKTKSISIPFGLEILDIFEKGSLNGKSVIAVDASLLKFPLVIRHKKDGDFFFPLGMNGKKKLSKFLRDEKINVISKAEIWVLTDAQDAIIWVVGLRADSRFQTGLKTKKSICFKVLD
jgi:tRNA(Ile)-lysidine synthase